MFQEENGEATMPDCQSEKMEKLVDTMTAQNGDRDEEVQDISFPN